LVSFSDYLSSGRCIRRDPGVLLKKKGLKVSRHGHTGTRQSFQEEEVCSVAMGGSVMDIWPCCVTAEMEEETVDSRRASKSPVQRPGGQDTARR
jgi:hypothetical protein